VTPSATLRAAVLALGPLLLTAQSAAPAEVTLVPANGSSLSGDQGGFTLSKCGSDKVSVLGVDAEGNFLAGRDAGFPNLTSDSALLKVVAPSGNAPNLFTIVRSSTSPPKAGVVVHLTASVMPPGATGEEPVESDAIPMTFNADICGVFTEFALSAGDAGPEAIVAAPDGNLWFTERNANRIGKITTDGAVREFSTGLSPSSQPHGITAGSDHAVWFTEFGAGKIGKITAAGEISEFAFGRTEPYDITTGSDDDLWVTENSGGKIAQMTTAGAVSKRYATNAADSQPHGIAAGPDGNLWITECSKNDVVRLSTDGELAEFAVPTAASCPEGIVAGSDDNLWFTERNGNKIGRITTAGAIKEYSLPKPGSGPAGITSGQDGDLYFAEFGGHRIGQIDTDGTIVEFSNGLSAANTPNDVAAGADGSIWFTDPGTGKVGRLQ
jgi:streptogramin lyase